MSNSLLQAVLGGAAAWLFGPGGLLPAFVYLGCFLAALLVAEVALRRWALRRALPFVPRRAWRTAWRDATYAASASSAPVRSLPFGISVAQVAQGRPFWALDPNGWVAVGFCAVSWFIVCLWNCALVAAPPWPAANGGAAPEPKREAP